MIKYIAKIINKLKKNKVDENYNAKEALQLYMSEQNKNSTVVSEISFYSAVKIIGILLVLFLFWKFIIATSNILILLFFALFLSSALYPSVRFFENKKIPSSISVLLSIILLLAFIGGLILSILPAVIDQGISLANWILENIKRLNQGDFSNIPNLFVHLGPYLQKSIQSLDEYLISLQINEETQTGLLQYITNNISKFKPWQEGVTSAVSGIVAFIFNFLLVLVLTFFLLLERNKIINFILNFFNNPLKNYLKIKGLQMQDKISGWIHGQMILFFFMGIVTWALFSLLNIEYAITLGFIAGIAEFIPYIGPLITFIIGIPLAFGESIEVGIIFLIFFICLQFIEGNILVPLVMEKVIGISAITTILSLLIGYQTLGILGAIIAIPISSIISIFIFDFQNSSFNNKKIKKE
jgi:predicted PurR-regulated permease PerM